MYIYALVKSNQVSLNTKTSKNQTFSRATYTLQLPCPDGHVSFPNLLAAPAVC